MFSLCLPEVEILMALIITIHHPGLSRGYDLGGKKALIGLAICEKDLGRNRVVQIKANMDLGFFGAVPIIGPVHGKDGIDPSMLIRFPRSSYSFGRVVAALA